MKKVIELTDEVIAFVEETSFVEDERTLFRQSNADRKKTLMLFDIIDAIRNGTPLPEHHGRLIDADDANNHIIGSVNLSGCPTIIEGSDSK